MSKHDGYGSTDKREAVKYIANNAHTHMVKSAAEAALKGETSLDAALVTARESGQQNVIVDTANAALGMKR